MLIVHLKLWLSLEVWEKLEFWPDDDVRRKVNVQPSPRRIISDIWGKGIWDFNNNVVVLQELSRNLIRKKSQNIMRIILCDFASKNIDFKLMPTCFSWLKDRRERTGECHHGERDTNSTFQNNLKWTVLPCSYMCFVPWKSLWHRRNETAHNCRKFYFAESCWVHDFLKKVIVKSCCSAVF